jgi:hypothetical protein
METLHAIALDSQVYTGAIPSPHAMLASTIERIEPIPMATSSGLVYGNVAGLSLINSFESLSRDIETLKMRADMSERRADASEKDAAETKIKLAALSQTVDQLKKESKGYRVVRSRFLDTFKRGPEIKIVSR